MKAVSEGGAEFAKATKTRQQYESQLQENTMVKEVARLLFCSNMRRSWSLSKKKGKSTSLLGPSLSNKCDKICSHGS